MRNVPMEVVVIAAPPGLSRLVPVVVTVTVRPLTDDDTDDRAVPGAGVVLRGVGDVGLESSLPHPAMKTPAAASEAA
jgi:hypothetical protein